jgi:hypothetical protein
MCLILKFCHEKKYDYLNFPMSNGRYTFLTVLTSFNVIFIFLRNVSFTNNGKDLSLSLLFFLSLSLSFSLSCVRNVAIDSAKSALRTREEKERERER